MPDPFSSKEIKQLWEGVKNEQHRLAYGLRIAIHTIRALAQRLADSPCPVCSGGIYFCSECTVWVSVCGCSPGTMDKLCPHCGGFPEDRLGKAFATKEAAIDSLMVGLEP